MRKITYSILTALFAICLGYSQHTFSTVVGPVLVNNGSPETIDINDMANSSGAVSGTYAEFTISADWSNVDNAWSAEADLTVTTAAGSVTIDPPSSGAEFSGNDVTITFSGVLPGPYNPDIDGLLSIDLNQSWTGSSANWSNISVTISPATPAPNCAELPITPADGATDLPAFDDVTISWTAPSSGPVPTSYDLYIGTEADGSDQALFVTTEDTFFSAPIGAYDITIFWSVVPKNGLSEASGCQSSLYSFTSGSQPPPPSNDLCSGAIAVEVGDGACGTVVNATNEGATDSGIAQASCATATYSGGDIWFSFEVPNGESAVNYIVSDSNFSTTQVELYSGSCGALVEVDCTTSTSNSFTGLTGGQTYFLRIYDWGNDDFGGLSFCLGTPPPPPANDDPADAIGLIVGADFAANQTVVTNTSATASEDSDQSIPDPSCSSYSGGDIWYSLLVPDDGIVTIETNNDPNSIPVITDTGMTVYTGQIGALVEYECDDDDSDDGLHSLIAINDQALANQTIYIRVFEFGNNSFGDWLISAYSSTLSTLDFQSNELLSYYPNPTKDKVQFEASTSIDRITAVNMLGQIVLDTRPNSLVTELDMTALQTGTYVLQVTMGHTVEKLRIIKK